MSTKLGAYTDTADEMARVAHAWGLDLVVVFGSRASGAVHARSDTDVAVCRRDSVLDFDDLVDLSVELGGVLGVQVDLVDLRRADPLLLRQIFYHEVVLFAAPGAFEREQLRAFHRYQDYRPYLALEREAVRQRLLPHGHRQ